MSKLVRHDAGRQVEGGTYLVQIITKLTDERLLAVRSREQVPVRRHDVHGTKEAQPLDYFTDEGVDRNQPFGFEFSERHMDRPLIWAYRPKTVTREIGTFANTDSCVSNQQKCISAKIVAI